jgi:hypothetical protein
MSSNPPLTTLSSGQSTRYTYSIWLYVQEWNTNGKKIIFNRDNNVKLYLDTTTPTLYCDVTLDPSGSQTIKITDNFPLQKWVYISICSDNMIVDSYLDGKLVNSSQLSKSPRTPGTPSANPMNLGTGFNAYVSGFTSYGYPMGPQEVWNNYMSGNGRSVLSRLFSSYNVDVAVSKDNVEQDRYRVF